MDSILYILLTGIAIFVSLIGFIILLTVHIVKKKPFSIFSYILLLIFIVGLYLYIPSRYTYLGSASQQPKFLEQAIKLSINPYEKRLSYYFLLIFTYNNIKLLKNIFASWDGVCRSGILAQQNQNTRTTL